VGDQLHTGHSVERPLVGRLSRPWSQSDCGGKEKNPCFSQESNPGHSARSQVINCWAVPAHMYRNSHSK
jgi:hypothetical protein